MDRSLIVRSLQGGMRWAGYVLVLWRVGVSERWFQSIRLVSLESRLFSFRKTTWNSLQRNIWIIETIAG